MPAMRAVAVVLSGTSLASFQYVQMIEEHEPVSGLTSMNGHRIFRRAGWWSMMP